MCLGETIQAVLTGLSKNEIAACLASLEKLREDVFQHIYKIWGAPHGDRLIASRLNQSPKYVPWKPVVRITLADVFSFILLEMFAYLFSSFCFISRCLQKLENIGALYWASLYSPLCLITIQLITILHSATSTCPLKIFTVRMERHFISVCLPAQWLGLSIYVV